MNLGIVELFNTCQPRVHDASPYSLSETGRRSLAGYFNLYAPKLIGLTLKNRGQLGGTV